MKPVPTLAYCSLHRNSFLAQENPRDFSCRTDFVLQVAQLMNQLITVLEPVYNSPET